MHEDEVCHPAIYCDWNIFFTLSYQVSSPSWRASISSRQKSSAINTFLPNIANWPVYPMRLLEANFHSNDSLQTINSGQGMWNFSLTSWLFSSVAMKHCMQNVWGEDFVLTISGPKPYLTALTFGKTIFLPTQHWQKIEKESAYECRKCLVLHNNLLTLSDNSYNDLPSWGHEIWRVHILTPFSPTEYGKISCLNRIKNPHENYNDTHMPHRCPHCDDPMDNPIEVTEDDNIPDSFGYSYLCHHCHEALDNEFDGDMSHILGDESWEDFIEHENEDGPYGSSD